MTDDLGPEPGCSVPLGGSPLAAGRLVFERYRLKRPIGRGGFGVVWLVHDEELLIDVALKFLSESISADAEAMADLKRETRNSLRLTHPNIIRIHDFIQRGELAGISMEFVDGDTLSALKAAQSQRCFNAEALARPIGRLCEALEYAHSEAQIVHRDLKPGNLMLDRNGTLKVADFGISRSISDTRTRLTDARTSSGTLAYMSPQQMTGESPSRSDDIYSLGATIYDLLSGKPPFFSGDLAHQVWKSTPVSIAERRLQLGIEAPPVPEEWERTIQSCLSKEAVNRPPSARAVAGQLGLVTISTPAADHGVERSAGNPIVAADLPSERISATVALPARPVGGAGRASAWKWLPGALGVGGLLVVGAVYLFGGFSAGTIPSVEPAVLDFSEVLTSDSATRSFVVTNLGARALHGRVAAVCPDFEVVEGGGEYTLGRGELRRVTVRFTPGTAGRGDCRIDLGASVPPVACSGVGVEPAVVASAATAVPATAATAEASPPMITRTDEPATEPVPMILLQPEQMDFGSVVAGERSAPRVLSVTNRGGTTLTGTLASACLDFILVSGGGDVRLAPGQSHGCSIVFAPTAAGPVVCNIDFSGRTMATLICSGVGQERPQPVRPAVVVPDTPPAVAVVKVSDETRIRNVLSAYRESLTGLDVDRFLALWAPASRPDHKETASRFQAIRSQTIELHDTVVRVDNEKAKATFRSRWTVIPNSGARQELSQSVDMSLIRISDEWFIAGIRVAQ